MDFADALHLSSAEELEAFATMDRKLAEKAAKVAGDRKVITV